MRIAVTGGSGNVGSVVTRRLIELNHEVIVLDKRPPRAEGTRFVYVDLRNREILQPAIEGCDAVVHLGELSHQYAGESPQQVYATNCAIGSTVIQTAADLKIPRFIYTSSCQAYGHWGGGVDGMRLPVEKFPMDETHPLRPMNPYGLAKASNEQFAAIVSRRSGMSVAIFRLPYVLPEQHAGRWVRSDRRQYDVFSENAEGFWTFVHSDDVADAYAKATQTLRPGCEAYHFVSRDIAGSIPLRERIATAGLTHLPRLPSDWPTHAAPVSTAKAREHFGWEPKHSWASIAAAAKED